MPQVTAVAKAHMLFDFIEPLVKDVEGLTEDVDDEVCPGAQAQSLKIYKIRNLIYKFNGNVVCSYPQAYALVFFISISTSVLCHPLFSGQRWTRIPPLASILLCTDLV